MNAMEIFEAITKAIEVGKTVYVSTHLRCTKIDSKTAARFAKIDRPVFKVKGNSLYMTSGKSYVCISYCRITIAQ